MYSLKISDPKPIQAVELSEEEDIQAKSYIEQCINKMVELPKVSLYILEVTLQSANGSDSFITEDEADKLHKYFITAGGRKYFANALNRVRSKVC